MTTTLKQSKEPQNGEYLCSSWMWEQIRQGTPPVFSSNKALLKKWLHYIGRKTVPLNRNSRVCSRHFKNSHKRKLRLDEYLTENLLKLATRLTPSTPRRPLVRRQTVVESDDEAGEDDGVKLPLTRDVGVNTERDVFEELKTKVRDLEGEIKAMTASAGSKFSLKSIATDDAKVMFYTGFPSYQHLYRFLGSFYRAVDVQRLQESV